MAPQAAGHEQAWLRERLDHFAQPGHPLLQQTPDGHWRRISEERLADGGLLSFSIDITEQMRQSQALQDVLDEARSAAERLEDAMEALPAGFELWSADERLITANSELGRLYPHIAALLRPGVELDTLMRANHAAGALPVPADQLDAYRQRRRIDRHSNTEPTQFATGDGRWIRSHYRPTRDGSLVGVRVDVTELRNARIAAEQARRQAEAATRQLADAIEALPDGFALYDADDRLVVCNSRYRELYRESALAMRPGARFEDLLRYGLAQGQYPQAAGWEEAWLADRLARHRQPGAPIIQQLPGNRWLRIDERSTSEGGIAGVRTDVTELVRREQQLTELNARLAEARAQLEQLSETDALTGIANRRRFDRRLDEDWSRLSRFGIPIGLLLVDVDHFKRYNDPYGHPQGDACLCRGAAALAGCASRATDVVARYGGEEFVLLLPHVDRDEVGAMAQRRLAAMDVAAIEHAAVKAPGRLTLSVGAAWLDAAGALSKHDLLRAADRALYRAKQAGRHRVELDWR